MDIYLWLAFVAASAALLVIPGPTTLLVMSYALGRGWKAALPTATGVALATSTASGVVDAGCWGDPLRLSATLFTVLKWIGAAYLVWLGILALASGGIKPMSTVHVSKRRAWHAGQGLARYPC